MDEVKKFLNKPMYEMTISDSLITHIGFAIAAELIHLSIIGCVLTIKSIRK